MVGAIAEAGIVHQRTTEPSSMAGSPATGTAAGEPWLPSGTSRQSSLTRRYRTMVAGRRVLVFENRLLEILIYLAVGIILLVLGLVSTNVNYQVLFFILTAFFIFAIFRPTGQS
jgi:hypothetical protein